MVSISVVFIVSFPVFVACSFDALDKLGERNEATYASQTPVDLNFNNFSLDYFRLFLDTNTNTPSQTLRKCFRF